MQQPVMEMQPHPHSSQLPLLPTQQQLPSDLRAKKPNLHQTPPPLQPLPPTHNSPHPCLLLHPLLLPLLLLLLRPSHVVTMSV